MALKAKLASWRIWQMHTLGCAWSAKVIKRTQTSKTVRIADALKILLWFLLRLTFFFFSCRSNQFSFLFLWLDCLFLPFYASFFPNYSFVEVSLFQLLCVCVCVWSCSVVSDSEASWTVACQAPLPIGFPRREYCSELPFFLQEIFLTQRSNTWVSCIGGWFFATITTWEAQKLCLFCHKTPFWKIKIHPFKPDTLNPPWLPLSLLPSHLSKYFRVAHKTGSGSVGPRTYTIVGEISLIHT